MARAASKSARTSERGLVIERRFSTPGVHPFDELEAVVRRYKDDPLPGADQLALDGDPGPSDPKSNIGLSPLGTPRRAAHTRRGHARQP